jgi:hypothetical protein
VIGQVIGAVALAAVLAWLLGFGKRERMVAPEDDVETPTDVDELTEAEAEVMGEGARPITDAFDDDDDEDWGPGTSRSNLPGIG